VKLWLAALCVVLSAAAAEAHKPSDSYLELRADGARIAARWDIALRDLEDAIGLDADGDGAITWGELRLRQADISAYALPRLRLDADGEECTAGPAEHLVDEHSDGAYAVLRLAFGCPAPPRVLGVRDRLLFDLDPQHRGVLHFRDGAAPRVAVLSADAPERQFERGVGGGWRQLGDFWRDGVWHIWAGFDHVLFLLALLIPAVLERQASGWGVVSSFRPALRRTLEVVTAFTLAHSLTLTLSAVGAVELPARLVESVIAASVLIAALNNAVPIFSERRWPMAFGFGLLHGFGFASVLADAQLPRQALLVSLLGFNAGVETGQIALVAAFLPLAYALRRSWLYRNVALPAGSLGIAALAAVWLVERAFGG
jgi:hypothetical protein